MRWRSQLSWDRHRAVEVNKISIITIWTSLIFRKNHPFIATLMAVAKDIMLISNIYFVLPAIDFSAIGLKWNVHHSVNY